MSAHLKPTYWARGIGADHAKEIAKRNAAPFADGAPALDADMAGDLGNLRQRAQLVKVQCRLPGIMPLSSSLLSPSATFGALDFR